MEALVVATLTLNKGATTVDGGTIAVAAAAPCTTSTIEEGEGARIARLAASIGESTTGGAGGLLAWSKDDPQWT